MLVSGLREHIVQTGTQKRAIDVRFGSLADKPSRAKIKALPARKRKNAPRNDSWGHKGKEREGLEEPSPKEPSGVQKAHK